MGDSVKKIIATRRARLQWLGVAWTLLYAAFVVWLYAAAPRTLSELRDEASAAAGTYAVDEARFEAGRELFRREQYRAARDEWARADPARRDARTQFYVAYAFYREGWGRLYSDDALYQQGLEAVERAINLSPGGALAVDDPDLRIHSAAELKAELQRGVERDWGDLNPLKVMRERK
jgi:tetratricopeptide (TPR) repeat protein